MNSVFYAPLSFVLIVFFIYFICKILAWQQAFEKDPAPDENPVSRYSGRSRNPRGRYNDDLNGTGRIDPYTISGHIPQVNVAEMESPPKYEMPPAYHEVVFQEKEKAPKSTVVSIESG